jgi:hypothetical protein
MKIIPENKGSIVDCIFPDCALRYDLYIQGIV